MSLPANPVPDLSRRVGELEARVAKLEQLLGARPRPSSSETRCELTDLPVDQCGHCLGHDETPDKPLRASSVVTARYDGQCGHCGAPFHKGDDIALADIHGDGSSDEWCIAAHTRDSNG